jgi:hypothetical protein
VLPRAGSGPRDRATHDLTRRWTRCSGGSVSAAALLGPEAREAPRRRAVSTPVLHRRPRRPTRRSCLHRRPRRPPPPPPAPPAYAPVMPPPPALPAHTPVVAPLPAPSCGRGPPAGRGAARPCL